jgi:hypothetical protein
MSDRGTFVDAVAALGRAFDELDRPWMVIGGVAVIAHGIPRATIDVDATVSGVGLDLETLLSTLGRHGIVPRIHDAGAFARQHQVVLVEHSASKVPVDISLAWLPFEDEAIEHRVTAEFAGTRLPLPRPEDLLIYKLVAARPRDLDDAERLIALYRCEMDLARVSRVIGQFCDILEDASRVGHLQDLLARAGLRA